MKPKDGSHRDAALRVEAAYPKKRMDKPVDGAFSGMPGVVRMSTLLSKLKAMEDGEHAYETIRNLHREVGDNCPVHGPLEDPIIGLVGKQVAFACPWCSSAQMLAAWEAEGG